MPNKQSQMKMKFITVINVMTANTHPRTRTQTHSRRVAQGHARPHAHAHTQAGAQARARAVARTNAVVSKWRQRFKLSTILMSAQNNVFTFLFINIYLFHLD